MAHHHTVVFETICRPFSGAFRGASGGDRTRKLSGLSRATLPICPRWHLVLGVGLEPTSNSF